MKKLFTLLLALSVSVVYGHTMNFINIGAPGGSADTFIGIYSPCLAANNIDVIKSFKPGAEGLIGIQHLLSTKDTDEVTNVITGGAGLNATNKYPGLETMNTLQPVIYMGKIEVVLVTANNVVSVASLKELSKSRPLNVGVGSAVLPTIAREWMTSLGLDYQLIPYKTGAGPLVDLINGNLDLAVSMIVETDSLIHAGKLKVVTSTMDNAMAARFEHRPISYYVGDDKSALIPIGTLLTVRKGAPKKNVELIKAAVNLCNRNPAVIAKLAEHNSSPINMSTEEINRLIKTYKQQHE